MISEITTHPRDNALESDSRLIMRASEHRMHRVGPSSIHCLCRCRARLLRVPPLYTACKVGCSSAPVNAQSTQQITTHTIRIGRLLVRKTHVPGLENLLQLAQMSASVEARFAHTAYSLLFVNTF
jgi:hypothetical protein